MDVLATLRPVAVEVQLGQWTYELPALPAADWIAALADPDGGAIIPGLLDPADQRLIWRDYLHGEIDPGELKLAWREVVGVVTGRQWWVGARLVLNAVHPDVWATVHGRLVKEGIDLDVISIGAFCNAIWVMIMDGAEDDTERSQAKLDLTLPPPDVAISEMYDREEAGSSFLAAMQQMQNLRSS